MHAALRQAAEGVVIGEMTLSISKTHCQTYERRHDRVAEVTVVGTSIVSFGRPPDPPTARRSPSCASTRPPKSPARAASSGLSGLVGLQSPGLEGVSPGVEDSAATARAGGRATADVLGSEVSAG